MKIAVDARPLARATDGIGRYTQSLLAEMMPARHEWYLYSDCPFDSPMSSLPNVEVRCGNANPSSVAGIWYSQGLYRLWCSRDKVEIFWSPRHHLPFALDGRVPQVVTIHDLVWKRFPETMPWQALVLERILMPAAIKQAAKIVCVSEFTASEVAHYWPRHAQKCEVIRSAPVALGPERLAEEEVNAEHPYILFVGTLEPRKNLLRLLGAYSNLAGENRIVENLVIAGAEGWGDVNLADLIRELGIGARVLVTGHLNDERLGRLYRGARCLVMPSLYEGFGLPVLEAMKYGVPVIISNAGSLPEVAGSAALQVDPLSEDSIKQALVSLLTDDRLHEQLSSKARERAAEFLWQRAARNLLHIFENL